MEYVRPILLMLSGMLTLYRLHGTYGLLTAIIVTILLATVLAVIRLRNIRQEEAWRRSATPFGDTERWSTAPNQTNSNEKR